MLSFHISDKPEPQQGKSSPIQKGLLPSLQGGGADLCGEGLGFGTPILQYRRDFYFPGSSTVTKSENEIKSYCEKVFHFNLIERKQQTFRSDITSFSWTLPRMHNLIYKTNPGRQLLKLVAILSDLLFFRGARKQFAPQLFIPVKSRGESRSRFNLYKKRRLLEIECFFDSLERTHLKSIYLANELGGWQFTEYYDSTGLYLVGNQIEPWAKIKGHWAVFYAPKLNVGFRVEIPDEITAYRGREVFEQHDIFWSGVILKLPRSITSCKYQVRFGTLKELKEVE
ncbi:MAG: hypothetical protein ACFE8O_03315 [Candidatus Hermodarchaeota archaeon]